MGFHDASLGAADVHQKNVWGPRLMVREGFDRGSTLTTEPLKQLQIPPLCHHQFGGIRFERVRDTGVTLSMTSEGISGCYMQQIRTGFNENRRQKNQPKNTIIKYIYIIIFIKYI
jgi:hypothetical protein